MIGWRNVGLRALWALCALLFAVPAAAQTFTTAAITASRPHFGVVAAQAGTATADITINTAGTIVTSPTANTVVNATGMAALTLSITCSGGCSGASQATLTITRGAGSARLGQISNIVLGAGTTGTSGTIVSQSYNAGTGVLTATLSGWTANNQARTFNVGMTVPVVGDATNNTTAGTSAFTVTTNGGSRNGTAAVTVRRSITVAKVNDLVFGNVRLPTTASGTVTMPTNSDTRTVAGGAAILTGITANRAQFTITGQASTAVAMSVATSPVTLTSGANTLSSTLTLSATTGTLSAGGTLTVFVGGVLTLPSTAVAGTYTGSFNFTANYN